MGSLIAGDCRRLVCNWQSAYGRGRFAGHYCLCSERNIEHHRGFSGFSDPNVILIAALFIIGDGLVRTGVATVMGAWLVKVAGSSEVKMLVLLMITVAGLGAFMSSTGVVAIFIPVVLSVSMRMQISPSRLMMPLSFAGLISGMMTLVATPPNLVVNSELLREGLNGFSFFSVTPLGAGGVGTRHNLYAGDAFYAERRRLRAAGRRLEAPDLSRPD